MEPADAVDVGLRPGGLHEVAHGVAEDVVDDVAGPHGALAIEVDRVDHLRVAELHSGHPAALDPHVDAERRTDLDGARAAPGERGPEVAVLEPPVEHEAFVEEQSVDHRAPERHVAPVGAVGILDPGRVVRPASLDAGERLLDGEAGTVDPVGEEVTGGRADVGTLAEHAPDLLDPAGVGHEVVVEEDDHVRPLGQRPEGAVALARRALRAQQDGDVLASGERAGIAERGAGDDDRGGLHGLPGDRLQGAREDLRTPEGRVDEADVRRDALRPGLRRSVVG